MPILYMLTKTLYKTQQNQFPKRKKRPGSFKKNNSQRSHKAENLSHRQQLSELVEYKGHSVDIPEQPCFRKETALPKHKRYFTLDSPKRSLKTGFKSTEPIYKVTTAYQNKSI